LYWLERSAVRLAGSPPPRHSRITPASPRSRSPARTRPATGATERTRLLCFSGAGFTDELRGIADRDRTVELIDLNRLHEGE
jgi:hypothetical protein